MAYSKAAYFDTLAYHQSLWSKATAHPARIKILCYLFDHGTTPFYILAPKIPLAKSTVSQHLRILRQAGLIQSFEIFPHTYYQLNPDVCKALASKIKPFTTTFADELST